MQEGPTYDDITVSAIKKKKGSNQYISIDDSSFNNINTKSLYVNTLTPGKKADGTFLKTINIKPPAKDPISLIIEGNTKTQQLTCDTVLGTTVNGTNINATGNITCNETLTAVKDLNCQQLIKTPKIQCTDIVKTENAAKLTIGDFSSENITCNETLTAAKNLNCQQLIKTPRIQCTDIVKTDNAERLTIGDFSSENITCTETLTAVKNLNCQQLIKTPRIQCTDIVKTDNAERLTIGDFSSENITITDSLTTENIKPKRTGDPIKIPTDIVDVGIIKSEKVQTSKIYNNNESGKDRVQIPYLSSNETKIGKMTFNNLNINTDDNNDIMINNSNIITNKVVEKDYKKIIYLNKKYNVAPDNTQTSIDVPKFQTDLILFEIFVISETYQDKPYFAALFKLFKRDGFLYLIEEQQFGIWTIKLLVSNTTEAKLNLAINDNPGGSPPIILAPPVNQQAEGFAIERPPRDYTPPPGTPKDEKIRLMLEYIARIEEYLKSLDPDNENEIEDWNDQLEKARNHLKEIEGSTGGDEPNISDKKFYSINVFMY